MATIYEVRRDNLRKYIEEHGGPTSVARALGLSGPSYLSQLTTANRYRYVSEKTAREYETKLGLPEGWFDVPRDERGRPLAPAAHPRPRAVQETPPPVESTDIAVRCARAVFEALAGQTIPAAKFDTLLHLVIEEAHGKTDAELRAFAERVVGLVL